jgi:hypothetical protein
VFFSRRDALYGSRLDLFDKSSRLNKIILDFKLKKTVPLTGLRIHCLPLIMETTHQCGGRKVTIRSWALGNDGEYILVDECTVTLQVLRANVAKALVDVVFLAKDINEPDIYINGFGEVVKTCNHSYSNAKERYTMPDTASVLTLRRDELRFSYDYYVADMHQKDSDYRGSKDRCDCRIHNPDQLFPFHRSPAEMLKYLLYVLERKDPKKLRIFSDEP